VVLFLRVYSSTPLKLVSLSIGLSLLSNSLFELHICSSNRFDSHLLLLVALVGNTFFASVFAPRVLLCWLARGHADVQLARPYSNTPSHNGS
jgi:hypothetical protein